MVAGFQDDLDSEDEKTSPSDAAAAAVVQKYSSSEDEAVIKKISKAGKKKAVSHRSDDDDDDSDEVNAFRPMVKQDADLSSDEEITISKPKRTSKSHAIKDTFSKKKTPLISAAEVDVTASEDEDDHKKSISLNSGKSSTKSAAVAPDPVAETSRSKSESAVGTTAKLKHDSSGGVSDSDVDGFAAGDSGAKAEGTASVIEVPQEALNDWLDQFETQVYYFCTLFC